MHFLTTQIEENRTLNSLTKTTGIALALAVASLTGCSSVGDSKAMEAEKMSASAEVHCYGVNECKGHNDCKTANNACKGQGSCKGLGFVFMSEKACGDLGGTTSA